MVDPLWDLATIIWSVELNVILRIATVLLAQWKTVRHFHQVHVRVF